MSPISYRVEIDRDLCMGSGVCVMYAPGTFDIDDETKATVIDQRGNSPEEIREAASGCPTRAITIEPEG